VREEEVAGMLETVVCVNGDERKIGDSRVWDEPGRPVESLELHRDRARAVLQKRRDAVAGTREALYTYRDAHRDVPVGEIRECVRGVDVGVDVREQSTGDPPMLRDQVASDR